MTRVIGLRNIVTTQDKWYYLVFYDFDGYLGSQDLIYKISAMNDLSYVLYSTKHGAHYVSFTPLGIREYGEIFHLFQKHFDGYYSGQTIRMSRKEGEVQELISLVIHPDRPIVANAYNIYARRFNKPLLPLHKTPVVIKKKYHLVFEAYETSKT